MGKYSWWDGPKGSSGPMTGQRFKVYSDTNFKSLRKGHSTQLIIPAQLNLFEFNDPDFYCIKPVTESEMSPEVFSNADKYKFKDTAFAKVGHHFINNARIANEIFSLMDYLRMSQMEKNKVPLEARQDLSDNISYLIQMQAEAAFFAASAGYSQLKLDVRKTYVDSLHSEPWLKDQLLGSSFKHKELFGPLQGVHMKRLNNNPNMRARPKPATQYKPRPKSPKASSSRGYKSNKSNKSYVPRWKPNTRNQAQFQNYYYSPQAKGSYYNNEEAGDFFQGGAVPYLQNPPRGRGSNRGRNPRNTRGAIAYRGKTT